MLKNRLTYSYSTSITFSRDVRRHNILLRCLPAQETFMHVADEEFSIQNGFWFKEDRDGLGNRIIVGGTTDDHSTLEYSCCGMVDMMTYCIPDASPHPMFFLPSALTTPTPEILRLMPPLTHEALSDAMAITHSVYDALNYTAGSTSMQTTAAEALRQRQGVCQDYAHLMISLCRAAGYAARYVCGLMKGEGETHAWVEVYDGQCWYAFDPTNDTAVASGYIKLAHGRDVLDCPVVRGIYQGRCVETSVTKVVVTELND